MKKKDTIAKRKRVRRVRKTDKALPKIAEAAAVLSGSVIAQRVRCGRANCRCSGGGALHGPYFYHFWRERGRLKKRYLKPNEVEAARAACERGKSERRRRAAWRKAYRSGQSPTFNTIMREIEAMLQEVKAL